MSCVDPESLGVVLILVLGSVMFIRAILTPWDEERVDE